MDLSIGLVTLNAKFIHSALGLRYLRNAARKAGHTNVWIREFIINQPIWKIAAEIQKARPDVVGIGVYIWNRIQSFQLVELLGKQNPGLSIVIGGPEVSFEDKISSDLAVIAGEGERKWVEYLDYRWRGESPPREVLERWSLYGSDLPDLIPAYIDEDFPQLKNRIAYLETSRGCPYHCTFCLSALDRSVRYFDDRVVRSQIRNLIDHGVSTIKFVDRTFNLQRKRVMDLLRWLTGFQGVSFHFEVVGDLLDEEILEFLDTAPEGMFQFEIGIQTTTPGVGTLIHRKQNNGRLKYNLGRLMRADRVHIHADLIFGLPGETFEQMLDSFTEVFGWNPHEIQLGFLKFLPGAPIREAIDRYQYKYQSFPPYEVISNREVSAEQLTYLKQFTEVFDRFHNTKRFRFSIHRLLQTLSPAALFDQLLKYIEEHGLSQTAFSLDDQFKVFLKTFSLEGDALAMDLLKLDYFYHQRAFHFPEFLRSGLPESLGRRFKPWRGDGKTPLIPFLHEIKLEGSSAQCTPSPHPLFYAIIHPEKHSGYLHRPRIQRVEIQAAKLGFEK